MSGILSIEKMYTYANLQMAAEALCGVDPKNSYTASNSYFKFSGTLLRDLLREVNSHASKFPNSLAGKFIEDGWQVLAHQPNTTTGFSGTLFFNSKNGERVLSFLRSTGFLDDAARGAAMLRMRESPSTECCA